MRHVVVFGLMGSGKTTIGRRVATMLELPFVDGDEELERRTEGATAADVARDEGLPALHAREAAVARDALARSTPSVISPAASVIEDPAVRAELAQNLVVWLTAPAEVLAGRAEQDDHRPLIHDGDPVALFTAQLAARGPLIEPLADLVLDISLLPPDMAAAAIVAFVRDPANA